MKKIIAILLLVFVLGSVFALTGCDSCNKTNDTDSSTDTNADSGYNNTDTNVDSGIIEDQHNHELPASPSDDVSSDIELQ